MNDQEIRELFHQRLADMAERTIRCPCPCHDGPELLICKLCGFATCWKAAR